MNRLKTKVQELPTQACSTARLYFSRIYGTFPDLRKTVDLFPIQERNDVQIEDYISAMSIDP